MEVFEYYKSFEHKISKGKYTRFFLWPAGIAVGYLNRKFICLVCEICLPKTNIFYISDRVERIVGSTSNSSELNLNQLWIRKFISEKKRLSSIGLDCQ